MPFKEKCSLTLVNSRWGNNIVISCREGLHQRPAGVPGPQPPPQQEHHKGTRTPSYSARRKLEYGSQTQINNTAKSK